MILAIREMQAPVLALILLGACAIKMSRVMRARSVYVVLDATALFPVRWRRPATIGLCLAEMSLGLGLALTAGPAGAGGRATAVRLATALFFLIGMCALVELRERRPDLGCGCFGGLSSKPPGVRSVVRAGLLAGAALAGIHIEAMTGPAVLGLPAPGFAAARDLAIVVVELLLLAAVSPEAGEVLARLGYSEPCELRALSAQRAITILRRSPTWYRHSVAIVGENPADIWRELCWFYLVYPAREQGEDYEVVFAVETKPHRPKVLAAAVRPEPGHPQAAVPRSAERPASVPSGVF